MDGERSPKCVSCHWIRTIQFRWPAARYVGGLLLQPYDVIVDARIGVIILELPGLSKV
jgi:hypothetical protein